MTVARRPTRPRKAVAPARKPLAPYADSQRSVVVDTDVFIDILNDHPVWARWSAMQLSPLIASRRAVLVPLVFAELAAGYPSPDALSRALEPLELVRETLSWDAAFLAGRAFRRYRKRGGVKRSPLPDFYIGAHAASAGHAVLTRDPRRYRDYFESLTVIAPT